ncbi:hypothetical protein EJ08DRAFT_701704 [Tothia fuscella]|uniref:EGF domain-specific O-linked N-acetylglucosamine transferase n=1 Tax=Tothia fuscella TaxID=1048955 RepID=A0A9P4NHU4_9PEZI|nr:hypothetical protein EJ08DRAFT_701704 [Tothia fuscella]
MTIDVMQMATMPNTTIIYVSTGDIPKIQVVFADDHPDGPFYSLWTLISPDIPIIHLRSLPSSSLYSYKVILPLAGGGHPIWQGDWTIHGCEKSPLLSVFRRRVLEFYKIPDYHADAGDSLLLTLIGSGNLVAFGKLSLHEQIYTALNTDNLVGVHGAGLTHSMFMRAGSALVEILPKGLGHKGFRNLASLAGLHCFGTHASESENSSMEDENGADWQKDDVFLEEDRFLKLMEVAIKSMYNEGMRNDDIS